MFNIKYYVSGFNGPDGNPKEFIAGPYSNLSVQLEYSDISGYMGVYNVRIVPAEEAEAELPQAQPKSTICKCGIHRNDCVYHKD